jgi:monofunctional biosynthetic peptidoglycan transglycosylase
VGEVHALVGENGAGKSTLVRIIGGLHGRDSGDFLMDGEPVEFHSTAGAKDAGIAVIAAEDQQFLIHDGFDFAQIEKAMTDAGRGKRLRGASTISQQVAKNLFLWPGQSWLRKGLEAWFTVWIDFLWPKRRILEVYLNSAQFGRGIWGVEAASRAYFGKDAARLDRQEAALLAAVLPSPNRYRVVNSGPWVRERQAWILRQMQALGGTALLNNI